MSRVSFSGSSVSIDQTRLDPEWIAACCNCGAVFLAKKVLVGVALEAQPVNESPQIGSECLVCKSGQKYEIVGVARAGVITKA